MKYIWDSGSTNLRSDLAILLLRIGTGLMMLTHGIPKFKRFFSDGPVSFADPIGIGEVPSLVLAAFAEAFCSVLILIGFRTRLASIPPLIAMLVAVFVIHSDDPFNNKELALHYVMAYLVLLLLGSGKYSVDALVKW